LKCKIDFISLNEIIFFSTSAEHHFDLTMLRTDKNTLHCKITCPISTPMVNVNADVID
jgi:hypothetical protein